jgi:hypothetical protein
MAKEKDPFVVQDRRRFSAEGELTTPEAEASTDVPAPAPEPPVQEPEAAREDAPPPTAAEQQEQHTAYNDAGKTIDDMLKSAGAGKRPPPMEVNFEGLVNSLSVQAMMQLGVLREEGAPMRPDIIGARQTIDILSMLQEKTKGNLSEREAATLQNALFELRMAFVEITKAVTRPPEPGQNTPPGAKR